MRAIDGLKPVLRNFSGKQIAPVKFRGPAYKEVDWDHIFKYHSDWGDAAKQRIESGSEKNTFFDGMTKEQIQGRVKSAWSNREKISTQTDIATGETRIQYRVM